MDLRRRNLWPLPGGAACYPETLRGLLSSVGRGISRADLEASMAQLAPTVRSQTTLRGYTSVPVTLGLLERDGSSGELRLTVSGRRYAKTGELKLLREALVERVFGVQELLEELSSDSATCPLLAQRLAKRGITWNHPMAVRYRVWWLVAAEALDAKRVSRADVLTLTKAGRRLLERGAAAS